MKNQSMEPGERIIIVGLIFLIGILLTSLFPEGLIPDFSRTTPPLANPDNGANSGLTTPIMDTLRMIPVAQPRNPTDAGNGQLAVILLQSAPRVNFSGKVQQLSEQPQSDGQLHVWLQDATGVETRISVGPGWFLKYLGCPLAHDVVLEGSGFTFEKGGRNPLIYAKNIRLNGKVCQLRNDEGFALWSNKLQ
ncbi:MAG: hypothetical protein HQL76_15290 [Magnetococcales bacterium]|nr:hypothetical protein [Magnetococcales bacterium]